MNASVTRTAIALVLLSGLTGCKTVGESYSPWEWGAGFQVAPAFEFGESENAPTVHPTFSYARIGSSNWVELGGQLRWDLGVASQDIWLGPEVLLGRTSGSNGIMVGGIAGIPLGESRWNPSVYVGAGVTAYGSSGKVVKAGIDVQPWFFPW